MALLGYLSDENYLAIADAQVELRRGDRAWVARSAPSGAIYADVEPGEYEAILSKPGFGSKRLREIELGRGQVHQFRLLSDRMLGFAWPQWARAGEQVEFLTHSVEPFQLGLWRYGQRRVLVRDHGWLDDHGPRAMMQVVPDGSFAETGVEWFGGNMRVHSQVVAAPAETGLYYFRMKGESGAPFSFPLVVAPGEPRAPIAVLASTNTWNAYNAFGGRSNYLEVTGLAPAPTVNARQDLARYNRPDYGEWKAGRPAPLSFRRPNPFNSAAELDEVTDPIAGRQACHLAPAEWRTLGWLESQGFAYDLYSDHHLHAGELPLDAYRVLLLNVHPEYWSVPMYERVKEWVHRKGGRLVYLGGNGINGPVELLDAATMRCSNHWPDGAESRFHACRESEASLLGVVFTEAGAMTAAPYQALDCSHWIFEGTDLKNGDIFGRRTLHERCPGGASGHETDKMSPSTPSGARLLAKGLNADGGGAEMIYYEIDSGGAVFSAGSITFATALFTDEPCARITANVLRRFVG